MNSILADLSASVKITAFTAEVELICSMKCDEITAMKHNVRLHSNYIG